MPIRRHNKEHLLAADLPQEGFREASNDAKHGISHLSPALVAAVRASLVKKYQEAQVSVARCVNEPLCIAFGTSVSSPTVRTYQLYDLPKTVTVRLYLESTALDVVLRAISEWEQVAGTDRSRFLRGLLEDKEMHDDFFVRLPDHEGQRRMRKLRGIIILPAKRVTVAKLHEDDNDQFTLKYQHPCLKHANDDTARGPAAKFVYCDRIFSRDELNTYLVPRHWTAINAALKRYPDTMQLPMCPPGAAAPSTAVNSSASMRRAILDTKAVEEQLRPLAYQGGKCVPRALMMGLKMMDAEVFNELEAALSNCDDGLGKAIRACNNSRVVLQRKENVTTESLQELDNLLISDGQHCVFKHNQLILDPDDGTVKPFDEFVGECDAKQCFVAATAVVFETKAAALAWKQQAKKKRQRKEQQLMMANKRVCC